MKQAVFSKGIDGNIYSCFINFSSWLMPVILTTQEAEIRRITVQSQPGQDWHETLS
jgi:hypothetical protein